MAAVSTPCIKLCVIDPATGVCAGCFRTLDEIGLWASLPETERLAIMATLPGRARIVPGEGREGRDAPAEAGRP